MWDSATFLGALTPKFYVALTGTSSLISGLILIFEWWYFRKYGTSFIEQVSLAHLGPWLGGGDPEPSEPTECKVWRNPLALLRGAEYARLWAAARRAPLTYYDMNLSAQDHQAWFSCGVEGPAEEAMARAWREREPAARVAAARAALVLRPDCAAALLLLAEEDAPTVQEAERVLKRAWRAAETSWRALAGVGADGAVAGGPGGGGARARREGALLAHIKRRAAMCARRLGRLRDSARLFRELARDAPPALHALSLHENLLEVLLEQRAYADVQALLSRLETAPRSAAVCYTSALLRARTAAGAAPRSLHELRALDEIRRAIEYNPFVPEYLLELRPLTFPPEHILRRGDSEAVAYAFCHLRHWRAAEGALKLLRQAWGRGRGSWSLTTSGVTGACVDRELLPAHHAPAPRRAPALLPTAAALCALTALLALVAHRWPAVLQAVAAAFDPRRISAFFSRL